VDWHAAPLISTLLPWQQLVDSVEADDFEQAHRLIDAGTDVNAKDERGTTPFMRWQGCVLIVRNTAQQKLSLLQHLLKAGANIDAGIETGDTPLMRAIGGDNQFALAMIKAGAKVTYPRGMESPFMLPFLARSPAGPDRGRRGRERPDAEGKRPIHRAIGSEESLQMLIRAGQT